MAAEAPCGLRIAATTTSVSSASLNPKTYNITGDIRSFKTRDEFNQ
jgi:hypothetical protein